MYSPFDPTSNPALWHPPYKNNVPVGPFDNQIRHRSQLEQALNPQIVEYPLADQPATPPLRPGRGPFGPILTPAEDLSRQGDRLEREQKDLENQMYREDSRRFSEDAKIRLQENQMRKYNPGNKRGY